MNNQFTITRRIEIDAAHRVPDHKSKCFALHGHRYVIEATLVGGLHNTGEQKGMVMDFGFLKDILIEEVHDPCDHGLILFAEDHDVLNHLLVPITDQGKERAGGLPRWVKLYSMAAVPTAENLAAHWYNRVEIAIRLWHSKRGIQSNCELKSITVWETPNCFATYPS